MVTWFSDGQPSYNTMVDIDTNMFNHVSTLFTTAGYLLVPWCKPLKTDPSREICTYAT